MDSVSWFVDLDTPLPQQLSQPSPEHASRKTKNLAYSTLVLCPVPEIHEFLEPPHGIDDRAPAWMDNGPQLPCDGGSALTLDGSVRRTRRIPGRLNLRTEFRDSRAAGPALLLLMLTRFSGQFPLLPCLMIVRLCHDVLLRLRIGLPEDRCIRVAGFRRRARSISCSSLRGADPQFAQTLTYCA